MVAITPRSRWGASRPIPGGRHVAPTARRYFVCHWPVMGDRPNHQFARDIERVHLNQGWGLIGYNWVVSNRDGEIMEGAGRDVRGIHSPPRNTDGWGICICQPSNPAGVPTAPLSQAARNNTRALYEQCCQWAGRRLEMWWHGRDFATACPGDDIRRWVQQGMPAGAISPPTQPPPPGGGFLMALNDAQQRQLLDLVVSLHNWIAGTGNDIRIEQRDQLMPILRDLRAFNGAQGDMDHNRIGHLWEASVGADYVKTNGRNAFDLVADILKRVDALEKKVGK
jgi:hypothetical protein